MAFRISRKAAVVTKLCAVSHSYLQKNLSVTFLQHFIQNSLITMSESTVVIKQAGSVHALHRNTQKSDSNFLKFFVLCMWGLAAIISSTHTELSSNVTGISVTLTTQDCILMLVTTWFLAKGLSESNHYYILPWLLMSIWSMYTCHFTSIMKMFRVLLRAKTNNMLPWIGLAIDGLGFVLRAFLSLRVAHLAINHWYNKKLLHELKKHEF